MTTSMIRVEANLCREATGKKRHERREVASACCEHQRRRRRKRRKRGRRRIRWRRWKRKKGREKGKKTETKERGAAGQTWTGRTDVQEGRKLARLETISAVIYDALLAFQLCISGRRNELATRRDIHWQPQILGHLLVTFQHLYCPF